MGESDQATEEKSQQKPNRIGKWFRDAWNRTRQYFYNNPFIWAVLGFVGLVIIIVFLVLDALFLSLDLMKYMNVALFAPLVLGLAIWRSVIAQQESAQNRQQLELSRQSQWEDRFTEGVKLSANDNLTFRLGGFAALHALALEDEKMAERIWDYLGGFLRNPPDLQGWNPETNKPYIEEKRQSSEPVNESDYRLGHRPDIAKIVTNLRDIRKKYPDLSLDLSNAHLEGAFLAYANLQHAYLEDANLQNANLMDANLQNAHLEGANLQHAYLRRANLQGASLWRANLQDALLADAKLQGTNLQETKFLQNNLSASDFSQTKNLQPDQIKNKECFFLKGSPPPIFPDEWGLGWQELGIIEKTL